MKENNLKIGSFYLAFQYGFNDCGRILQKVIARLDSIINIGFQVHTFTTVNLETGELIEKASCSEIIRELTIEEVKEIISKLSQKLRQFSKITKQ